MKTRMMTRILSLLALVLCLCMVLTACAPGAETPDATKDSQDTANTEKNSEASSTSGTTTKLKLAAIIPVTGNNMQYGISYENALKMAVDDFNAAGGLNGQQIELVIHDRPKRSTLHTRSSTILMSLPLSAPSALRFPWQSPRFLKKQAFLSSLRILPTLTSRAWASTCSPFAP